MIRILPKGYWRPLVDFWGSRTDELVSPWFYFVISLRFIQSRPAGSIDKLVQCATDILLMDLRKKNW